MAGQPKPAFYVALAVVVVALIGFAIYRSDVVAPKAQQPAGETGKIAPEELNKAEAPDAASVTTVKEYKFRPAERLPAVTGTAAYKPLKENTRRFAIQD